MQRIALFLLAFWCGAFAQNQPMNDSAAAKGAVAPIVDSVVAGIAKDSAGSHADLAVKDSAAAVAAPTLDTLPVVAAPVAPAIDSVALAREKAHRDSIRAAREEAASSMEWHTVSDSGAAPAAVGTKFPEPDGQVTSRPVQRSGIPFPEVPQEEEPRVLMWTGVGLSVVGLVAFFAFTSGGDKQADPVNLNPDTDPTAGNPDAKNQKTMTIRWSH